MQGFEHELAEKGLAQQPADAGSSSTARTSPSRRAVCILHLQAVLMAVLAVSVSAAVVVWSGILKPPPSSAPSGAAHTPEPELRTVEPELQTLVPGLQSAGSPFEGTAKLVRAGNTTPESDLRIQLVTWRVGEKVGWVGEGNIVDVGEHGKITSLRSSDMTAVVSYPSNTWRHFVRQLYKVVATKYGFNGGQRVEFVGPVPNNGNIEKGQIGIVQAFWENSEHVMWWDLKQNIAFGVPPTWLAVPTPYEPVRGNGAWVPLHSVNVGGVTITEKIGTSKTHEETKSSSWAASTTSKLSMNMKAGVGFKGFSAEVNVGTELSRTMSQEHAWSQSYSWTMNTESIYSFTLPPNSGYLWQWHIRTEVRSGDVLTSKTRNFAVTKGLWEKPRCLPGYELDGAACQECYSEETTLIPHES